MLKIWGTGRGGLAEISKDEEGARAQLAFVGRGELYSFSPCEGHLSALHAPLAPYNYCIVPPNQFPTKLGRVNEMSSYFYRNVFQR